MAMANRQAPSSLNLLLLCFMFMALVHNAVVVAGQERKCEPSCTTPVYPPPPPPSPPPPSPPPPSPLLCPPPPAPCPWCYKPPPPPVPWCFKCNTPGYLYPTDPDYLLSAARRCSGARRWVAAGGLLMVLAVAF